MKKIYIISIILVATLFSMQWENINSLNPKEPTVEVLFSDISNTEIKDSILNRSNVGSGGKSKAEEIKEIKELLDSGAIDDEEFKQMKKEILGK